MGGQLQEGSYFRFMDLSGVTAAGWYFREAARSRQDAKKMERSSSQKKMRGSGVAESELTPKGRSAGNGNKTG